MKRKTIGAAAAYLSGSFFASFFMDPGCVLMIAATVIAAIAYGRRKSFSARDYGILGGAFAAAVLVSFAYTAAVYRPALRYDGETVSFEGTVTDCVSYDGGNVQYTLRGRINGGTRAKITYLTADAGADLGDTVRLADCRLAKPQNDYLYRSENAYKASHIQLRAEYARSCEVVSCDRFMLSRQLRDLRETATARLRAEMGSDCGGFLAGMIFGEKQYLDGNSRAVLYRTGIGHILAVSGLHVSIIAAVIMLLLERLHVGRFIAFGAVNALMLALILLANSPVSAVRAAIMLDLMYSARLFYRQNDSLNALSAAVLLICIFDPYCVYSAGFLLSAAGTAGIAVFAPYMTKDLERETLRQKLFALLATAICTTLAVFPLCVWFFDETSLVSPLTNVLLVPLCTVVMLLGLIWLVSFGLIPTLGTASGLIRLILGISGGVSSVGAFRIADSSGVLRIVLIAAAAAVITVHVMRGSRRLTAIMTASAAAVFCVTSIACGLIGRNSYRVAVLGSGTGSAVVVTHRGHADIADLSGHYRSAAYVRRYLMANGIASADTLLLTKNVQAQYSAYDEQLALFSGYSSIAAGDTEIYCGDAHAAGNGDIRVESGCDLEYIDGVLSVACGDREFYFEPSGGGSGLTVYCGERSDVFPDRSGSAGKNREEVLTGTNGFEIALSGSSYRIRRL